MGAYCGPMAFSSVHETRRISEHEDGNQDKLHIVLLFILLRQL